MRILTCRRGSAFKSGFSLMGELPTDPRTPNTLRSASGLHVDSGVDMNRNEKRQENDNRLDELFRKHGVVVKNEPDTAIVHQGAPASMVYRILRGCIRSCAYTFDGDRKVLQFLGAGDFLGLGDAGSWPASYEAVDMVVLEAIPRSVFEAELVQCPALNAAVRHELVKQIDRHVALLVLTAQTTAVERVRMFLRKFAARRGGNGFIALPMGRRDIADHLGLSMETVSRAFSTLKNDGDIALKGAAFFRFSGSGDQERSINHAA